MDKEMVSFHFYEPLYAINGTINGLHHFCTLNIYNVIDTFLVKNVSINVSLHFDNLFMPFIQNNGTINGKSPFNNNFSLITDQVLDRSRQLGHSIS